MSWGKSILYSCEKIYFKQLSCQNRSKITLSTSWQFSFLTAWKRCSPADYSAGYLFTVNYSQSHSFYITECRPMPWKNMSAMTRTPNNTISTLFRLPAGRFFTTPATKCECIVMYSVAAKTCTKGKWSFASGKTEKSPLLVANVACRARGTLCLCCHSFPLSLSGSAKGDINQSMETRAEAVMRRVAGESRGRQRWMMRRGDNN